ncbi:hypothetical protein P3X46_005683 [Hevea brasiliensis]|uniref:ABC transmembrane type-1 domain-containing protein n=1 Tax=Hevea brasiliensis TaxID=3981 RepID=A0ABQ9N332_HEVBR|nr:hypothetical protein P3X46_005683 [Hevea brasiliensis]
MDKMQRAGESCQSSFQPTVYKSVYGSWTLELSDVREVVLYRSGLVTAASAFVIAASDAFLPTLWVLGVVGSFAIYTTLARPAGENLIQYVVHNLLVLCLKQSQDLSSKKGIITGLMDDGVKLALLVSWMTLFVIFAGRKFTQSIKDDVGDKSVFMFNSVPEVGKKALIGKLEQQRFRQDLRWDCEPNTRRSLNMEKVHNTILTDHHL